MGLLGFFFSFFMAGRSTSIALALILGEVTSELLLSCSTSSTVVLSTLGGVKGVTWGGGVGGGRLPTIFPFDVICSEPF